MLIVLFNMLNNILKLIILEYLHDIVKANNTILNI